MRRARIGAVLVGPAVINTLLADCYYAGQDRRRAMAACQAADTRRADVVPSVAAPGTVAHAGWGVLA